MKLVLLILLTQFYLQPMQVIETTQETVVCADYNGNEWEYYGTTTETEITVLFFRNGTETIYDDAIVAVSPF